jgi:ribosomal protein L37AE/L43A
MEHDTVRARLDADVHRIITWRTDDQAIWCPDCGGDAVRIDIDGHSIWQCLEDECGVT